MNPATADAAFRNDTWLLFGGLGCFLLSASLIVALLKWKLARGQPHDMIDTLSARISAWWVIMSVIGLAFLFGKTGVVLLFLLVSFYALREFMTLAYTRGGDRAAIALAFYVGLPIQYFLVWIEWYGLYSIFIPVYGFMVLPILAAMGGDTKHFLERTSKLQWGLMISVYCISHVPALLTLHIPGFEGRNLLLIAFLLIVVQGGDVLRYVWGKLAGKTLLAPALSSSRTVEGLVGGVLSATVLGGMLYWITPFTPWQAALNALVICLMGSLGGLVMSAIKHDRGVKDWGVIIEGHGGMLDRLDSVVFAAPVFFHSIRWAWTP